MSQSSDQQINEVFDEIHRAESEAGPFEIDPELVRELQSINQETDRVKKAERMVALMERVVEEPEHAQRHRREQQRERADDPRARERASESAPRQRRNHTEGCEQRGDSEDEHRGEEGGSSAAFGLSRPEDAHGDRDHRRE